MVQDRHLFLFFRDELKLANSKKSASVCKKNGVISPNDFAGYVDVAASLRRHFFFSFLLFWFPFLFPFAFAFAFCNTLVKQRREG